MIIRLFATLLFTAIFSIYGIAQTDVSGKVIDKITKKPIENVTITIGAPSRGTTTDVSGIFTLSLNKGDHHVMFSCIGYSSLTKDIQTNLNASQSFGIIELMPFVIGLDEVSIISSMAVNRETPVAVSTITAETIETELGDQPLPEIMKMVPGVYPTRTGGGSGDAAINIRGFKQENVALLLNGIPISSVENGLVYWNNWLGLADATQQIQVQRGLGASKVALNSVGGTVNIITKSTEAKKGGLVRYSVTDYGNSKFTFSYNTGKLKNGLAITFLGSRIWGPGYVDATYVKAWGYFLSISKEIGKKHKLVFIGLGNPEKHGQRNFMLTKPEVDQYGLKFNKDWGSYNGKINNASENFYHKPHFSLNHYWNMSKKSFLATSAYLSYGYGGGKWSDNYQYSKSIFEYRNPSQQIDWTAIYNDNYNNMDSTILSNGDTVTGYSKNIQTDFLASHIWTGIISVYEYEVNDRFKFMGGIHYRYFKSKLQKKVRDLLGGQFYIDDYSWAVDGVSGRNEIKHVGDVIKVDNGAIINFANLFGQIEYSAGIVSAFISGSYSYNWYQREDRYNYVNDIKSKVVTKPGYEIKAGANFNINEKNNIFFNTGYFSRAPYYKFIFGNFTNEPSKDISNETSTAFELGYGYNCDKGYARLNAYYTYWKDRSFLANEYNQMLDPVMIKGLDALHKGIELEISRRINKSFTVGGMASIGDWKWKNNVSAKVFNNNNVVIDTVEVFANGLYVGDAPQTQFGFFGHARFLKQFNFKFNWVFYDKLFADFNPVYRNNPTDGSQPYEMPSYNVLDLHLGFTFTLAGLETYANISCFNALNSEYIV